MLSESESEDAIHSLIECIKFKTISGLGPINGSYVECAKWLLNSLQESGFESFILKESIVNKPIVVGTWRGTDGSLPGILLNSHYDVVPVDESYWLHEPFAGERIDGKIFGRGSQDMKSVCIQYLIAISKLKRQGYSPLRDIYITYVPDEEIGGVDGMKILLSSDWFSQIKIGLALDEGLANESDKYTIFYGERLPWFVRVKAQGNTGHASRFIDGTAVEQIVNMSNKALKFREQQYNNLHGITEASLASSVPGCSHGVAHKKKQTLGDVTSLNITVLRAGVQTGGKDVMNVVPVAAEAVFDIRISPNHDPEDIARMLDVWCEECTTSARNLPRGSGGVTWDLDTNKLREHYVTSTDPTKNPWWGVFTSALEGASIDYETEIFPAATDSRYIRELGLKAFGFSPMRRSPILLHEHDEYIDEDVFLEGCNIYINLINVLSSQCRFEADI